MSEWTELSVVVNREWAEAVEAAMAASGCSDAARFDAAAESGDPWALERSLPPAGPCEVRAYLPPEAEPTGITADLARRLELLAAAGMPAVPPVRLRRLREQDWQDAWKAHYVPMRFGRRLVVCPSWIEFAAKPHDCVIRLDPGMAFGTGTHPTTRLCLEALEEYVRPGERVLDWGTGSGILAFACALLGASSVIACDLDPLAVRVARENAVTAGCADRVRAEHCGIEALPERELDLIVANITADPIIAGLPAAVERLGLAGRLVLCGIIEHRTPDVLDALSASGLRVVREVRAEGWTLLVAGRDSARSEERPVRLSN